MLDLNATLPLLGPVAEPFQSLFSILEILVGGIFGIYVIMILLKIYYNAKLFGMLRHLRQDLSELKAKVEAMDRKLGKGKK
ncbi:MAG TPA: hypothetical protein VI387_05760 [Candidatus Brocadiales bacterium]|nr:hypothetical protein [Candidatus Woesearchaeota archaeon]HLG29698.1 hypothetical protein [Candidatus Brocadiales bacterium]